MAKRLYTESDVAAMPPGATLTLGKDALATPSAIDQAFARGVRIQYGDAKAAAAAPTASDVFAKMLAKEGTYVVSVQGGAAVVTRLENGVPVPFGTTK
ncbi:MAG: hypothetical protein ABI054_04250 [Planctomycetota bacterium]